MDQFDMFEFYTGKPYKHKIVVSNTNGLNWRTEYPLIWRFTLNSSAKLSHYFRSILDIQITLRDGWFLFIFWSVSTKYGNVKLKKADWISIRKG